MSDSRSESTLQPGEPAEVGDRVVALLAEYLRASAPVEWPGTDGLTLAEVVGTAYPTAVAAGRVPGLEKLIERHPELAGAIALFLRPVITTEWGLP